ncbi:MAG: methyltransferase domain-containing protein [Candidatus Methanoperedens sp.]|nr:methyltransferase domain-containing protein [Candidatus Methanoperedens sp.]
MKLHLGCGNIKLENFINIDSRKTIATDKIMDISSLNEYDNNSIELIYSCHCLEHFSYTDVKRILNEWNRVLVTNGELIIRVPNFDILVNTYLLRISKKGLKYRTLDINLLGDFLGGQDYPENTHKAFFNEKLTRNILHESGFINIKKIDYDYFPVNDASRHYSTMGFSSKKG